MILLEIFIPLFIIAMVLFGKIEISSTSFKAFLKIGGWTQPLVSISFGTKKNSGENVSI